MELKDEVLLAEEVQRITEELEREVSRNQNLSSELNTLERTIKRRTYIFEVYAALLFFATATIGCYFLYQTTFNRKTTRQCYLEQQTLSLPAYKVLRVVEWGADRTIAISSSMDEAIFQALKHGCQMSNSLIGEKNTKE